MHAFELAFLQATTGFLENFSHSFEGDLPNKEKVEKLLNSKNLEFKFYTGDQGGQWYSVGLSTGLFEVYIASDLEVGINFPSDSDDLSFGGCDEAYDDFNREICNEYMRLGIAIVTFIV